MTPLLLLWGSFRLRHTTYRDHYCTFAMGANERLPLMKRGLAGKRAGAAQEEQPTFRGAAKMLVGCVLLFAAAVTSARMFPHGDRGRPSSRGVELSEVQGKASVVTLEGEEYESTLAPGALG